MREYLAVATRPADRNGLGLKLSDALGNVRAIRERTTLLAEDPKVAERLLGLLADVEAGGKQVHDANVVATMLVHGIAVIVTMNLDDFARFGDLRVGDVAHANVSNQTLSLQIGKRRDLLGIRSLGRAMAVAHRPIIDDVERLEPEVS